MTLQLLVDTCVWLDLAKDYRQQPVIAALEDLVAAGVPAGVEHIEGARILED